MRSQQFRGIKGPYAAFINVEIEGKSMVYSEQSETISVISESSLTKLNIIEGGGNAFCA